MKLIGLGDFHGSELPFVFRNWLEFIKPIDPFQSPRHMSLEEKHSDQEVAQE